MKNYLLLFILLSCALASRGQSTCSEAATAAAGANSLPATANNEYWYRYTMPSEGKLQITSSSQYTSINIYSDACDNLDYKGGGQGSATAVTLTGGDEVFIVWYIYDGGDFDWNLSVEPLSTGDNCALAATATSGTNALPATANTEYWYKYTMPSEGKLQITSSSSKSLSVYSNSCNSLDYAGNGYEKATITTLNSGDEVLIKWYLNGTGDFDWDLTVSPLEAGDNCERAVEVTSEVNQLPATNNQYYWYRYTMPSDGRLQISSSSQSYVTVYNATCENPNYQGNGYENIMIATLSEGEEALIRWETSDGGDFSWNLSVAPLQAGDNCALAVEATEGTNSILDTGGNFYWYKYTMPSDGKLQITPASSRSVELYTNSCDDLSFKKYGYESVSMSPLASGDEVFIRWNASGGNLDWDLLIVPLAPGEGCSAAVAATLGTNTVPATDGDEYWYRYTMPVSGELQIASTSSRSVYVHSNTCSDLVYQKGGYENISSIALKRNDEVFIKWNNYQRSSFDWELSAVSFDEGEGCATAVAATEGDNYLPNTSYNNYWYEYTMPENGKLQITSSSSDYVEIYETCNALNNQGSGYGNASATTLISGDKVLVRWRLDNGGDFTWNISVVPFEPGEGCSVAVAAALGTNTTPEAPHWFKYDVPVTTDYTISSGDLTSVDTYLKVYSDCDRTLIDENDDIDASNIVYQSELTLSLTAGETIYILWHDYYTSEGFDWTLTSDASAKENQSITFNPLPTKTLADDDFALSATASSGLPVSYTTSDETVATVSGGTVTIIGAGSATITAYQAGGGTYEAATPVARTLTVEKVAQTITIDPIANQVVDAEPITVTASTTSGLSLDYTLRGPATLDGTEITLNGTEGTVTVTARQVGDAYYQATQASVSFTVTDPSLQDQTITFEAIPAKDKDDEPFTLVATASSGLPVSFSSSDETVATVSDNVVTIVGPGTATIIARQAGDDTYRATSEAQVLTVGGFEQTAVNCAELAATVQTFDATCHSAADGSLVVSATGGAKPYQYTLDGTTFQEADSFAALDSGAYTITVKDANGCTASVVADVAAPDALLIAGQTTASTATSGNGSIALNVSGGTAPYYYEWSHRATTATVSDLTLGDYRVTVTDALGCTAAASFSVEGVTAVDELPEQRMLAYPNPVREVLYVDLPAGSRTTRATLYSLAGRKVREIQLTEGMNRVDTQDLKAGSYLLKLDNGQRQRLVVK